MECGSLAHCRSSGFASFSGRPSGLCHPRQKVNGSASRGDHRHLQGCDTSCSVSASTQRCSRRQQVAAQAALADAVSDTAVQEFPRGAHWQVSSTLLQFQKEWGQYSQGPSCRPQEDHALFVQSVHTVVDPSSSLQWNYRRVKRAFMISLCQGPL